MRYDSKSTWLLKYRGVIKVILVIITMAWVGIFNIFENVDTEDRITILKLDTMAAPRNVMTSGPSLDDWRKRKDSAIEEVSRMLETAKSKGSQYVYFDYYEDLSRLMDLEDKYSIALTFGFIGYSHQFHELARVNTTIIDENNQSVISIQKRFGKRHGLSKSSDKPFVENLLLILLWLITLYVKLMVFWILFYLIRIEESYSTRFKEEIMLAPTRFFLRVLLWPKWFLVYPMHEKPAHAIRYIRLKARLLKRRSFGYTLSEKENQALKLESRSRINDYEKALQSIFSINIGSTQRTLLNAYCSLLVSVVANSMPIIVVDFDYMKIEETVSSETIDSACGNSDYQKDQIGLYELFETLFFEVAKWLIADEDVLKMKEPIHEIDHIPIKLLVCE